MNDQQNDTKHPVDAVEDLEEDYKALDRRVRRLERAAKKQPSGTAELAAILTAQPPTQDRLARRRRLRDPYEEGL